eukprot:CAMPEP_0194265600 /NCGR_PEP_ID=MMETSP0169-20130528/782_1 /TAXON_ID=218684 /ORGANISM="Corethron pennatum, Strain L29A3" /LENGTH=794 /DNA_ID=CAMNT_0039006095 /DNA_START=96 /DNA_END=2480 /DNA_ORIENTATION=+
MGGCQSKQDLPATSISNKLEAKDTTADDVKPKISEPSQTEEAQDELARSNRDPKKLEALITQHGRVRNQNVFAQPIEVIEGYTPPVYEKSDEVIKFIDSSLADNFIFTNLTEVERKLFISAMQPETAKAGNAIINQGDVGDFFYIVAEGNVNFVVHGNNVGAASSGASFGELALLYDSPRAASCIAVSDCQLWKVDQKTFRYMLANNTATNQKGILQVLRNVDLLESFDTEALNKVADALTSVVFQDGEKIINKGDVGEVFYIVREGRCKATDIGLGDSSFVDQEYTEGATFGERALLTGEPRAANITAIGEVSCLCLSRETFEKVLGPLQSLMDRGMTSRILMGIPIFANSKFEPFEMDQLNDLVEDLTFAKDTEVVNKGDAVHQALYIIRKGKVTVSNPNGLINTLGPGDHFGGQTLVDAQGKSTETVLVTQDATVGILTKASIEAVIGDLNRLGKPVAAKAQSLDSSILFNDLVKYRILGIGTFGKVWLVSHKKTGKPFALKMLSKHDIIGHKQVEGVIREKNILSSVNHPFVVNLVTTYQDDNSLLMLIEYVQGGELFSVIHTERRDGVPFEHARFYSACILESLAHLHERNICYRDLKPENVLVDGSGYCVLVDLGFAKIVSDKTYTLCGTPEYLAPEIILSKGHDKGVDYWAFGVLIFELLVGRSPFYSYGSDQVSLFKRIVQAKHSFPPGGVVNDISQDMIQRLIVRRQTNRLGCLAGADNDVRDHKFFAGVNNDSLMAKKIVAPWIPSLSDPLDASHFDCYKHIEMEAEPNRNPLTPKQQAVFENF